MDDGAIRAGIFVLIISALGTGILTLHHFFDQLGIWIGIGVFVLVTILFTLSSDILIFSLKKSDNAKSLNQLVENILGYKVKILFDIIFFLYIFLVMVSFVLTTSKTFYLNFGRSIMEKWFDYKFKDTQDFLHHFKDFNIYFAYVVGFIFFLLILQKDVQKFKYASLFSFMIYIYIILIIIIQFPVYYKQEPQKKYNFYNFELEGFFQNFGIAIFSFNCLTNFFSVASAIKNPNIRRLRKVFIRSFSFLLILCIAVGILGYLSVGKDKVNLVDLIIYREQYGETDYCMQIARVLLIVALFVNASINAFPLKKMAIHTFSLDEDLKLSHNILICLFFAFIPSIIASFFTSIQSYVSITGCFSGMFIVFIFPCLLGIKIQYFKKKVFHYSLYVYLVLLLLLTIFCTYFTTLKFINDN